jgi:hypothetical protein
MSQAKNDRPQLELRAGGIVGAAWTTTTVVDGRAVPQHSIRIEKRYRDDRTGEWKTTGYLRPDDLPRIVLVASKLFEYLTLREGSAAPRPAQAPPTPHAPE